MSVQTVTAIVSALVAVGALGYSIIRDSTSDTRQEERRLVEIEASIKKLQSQAHDTSASTGSAGPPDEKGDPAPFKVALFNAKAPPTQQASSEMGKHQACFLTGNIDQNRVNNAAICKVNYDSGKWSLVAYGAECRAACISYE